MGTTSGVKVGTTIQCTSDEEVDMFLHFLSEEGFRCTVTDVIFRVIQIVGVMETEAEA